MKKRYTVIYADPPWRFAAWSHRGEGRGASQHYGCMTIDDLCDLRVDGGLKVNEICEDDAALFLWVVQPMLPEALRVIEAWGFNYRTVAFVWIKLGKNFSHDQQEMFGRDEIRPKMGLGYHTRSESEQCWLAIRGKGYKKHSSGVRQVIHEGIREHSRKPDQAIERIDKLVGNVARIELFARERHPGWDCWGAECDKFPMRMMA